MNLLNWTNEIARLLAELKQNNWVGLLNGAPVDDETGKINRFYLSRNCDSDDAYATIERNLRALTLEPGTLVSGYEIYSTQRDDLILIALRSMNTGMLTRDIRSNLTQYGDIMSLADFRDSVRNSIFGPDDGNAYLIDEMIEQELYTPEMGFATFDDIMKRDLPPHINVVWFNR